MNKSLYLISLIFILSLAYVSAIDKNIAEFDGMYNFTVTYDLIDGNATNSDLSFNGCSDLGNDVWFCNTRDIPTFNLTMHSNEVILRQPRAYDFTIDYNYYDIKSASADFSVEDWGDYVVSHAKSIYSHDSSLCNSQPKIVYINHSIEVPIIEYRDRNITIERNVTLYIENTSKIDELNFNLINLTNSSSTTIQSYKRIIKVQANFILFMSFVILGLAFWVYKLKRVKGVINNG